MNKIEKWLKEVEELEALGLDKLEAMKPDTLEQTWKVNAAIDRIKQTKADELWEEYERKRIREWNRGWNNEHKSSLPAPSGELVNKPHDNQMHNIY